MCGTRYRVQNHHLDRCLHRSHQPGHDGGAIDASEVSQICKGNVDKARPPSATGITPMQSPVAGWTSMHCIHATLNRVGGSPSPAAY